MTKKQKDFISKASVTRKNKIYTDLFIADSGTLYKGFFGPNGYNNMVIIGRTEDGSLELISRYSDHFWIADPVSVNMDIMKENGFMRIWIDGAVFRVPAIVTSSCIVYPEPKERGRK